MPVPISISELSTTPGSNSPSGSDSPSVLDDHLRTAYAFIKTLSDEKAAIANTVLLTGNQTIAGTKTFSSPIAGSVTGTAANVTSTVAIANGGTGQTTAAGIQSILPIQQTRVDVASAATVNLTSSVPSNDHINVTGTTTITAFTVAAGRLIFVRFNAALTLTNNASIVTQTGANIVTVAGDTCILRATAANVVEVLCYTSVSANAQAARSRVKLRTANGYGSTSTVVRRFTTVDENVGSDIVYADSATLGATFTIAADGVYSISYSDQVSNVSVVSITKNSATLTGLPNSAETLAAAATGGASQAINVGWSGYLASGDVIRAQTQSGSATGSVVMANHFSIVRVA